MHRSGGFDSGTAAIIISISSKLKTVILHDWVDLEQLFKVPFAIIWQNGLFLLPTKELGKELRVYHQSKWQHIPTEEPIPLAPGIAYQLGPHHISVDTAP